MYISLSLYIYIYSDACVYQFDVVLLDRCIVRVCIDAHLM